MPAEQNNQPANAAGENGQGSTAALTPELVREVAEKVYALMLRDLKIDRERQQGMMNVLQRKGARR